MSEWIRCEDRIPTDGQMCVIYIPAFPVFKKRIRMGEYDGNEGAFWIERQWWRSGEVTHWAGLEVPKETENEHS